MRYKILFSFLIFISLNSLAFAEVNPIDAARNAKEHNNQGVIFLNENDFYAAIKEFQLAIGLNQNAQATSVYYNNLGRAYMKLFNLYKDKTCANIAKNSFEHAILGDCMNISYYKNLVESYSALGILDLKLDFLLKNKDKNPYNMVIVGLIYIKQNKTAQAVAILDDFVCSNPDLIISKDIRKIIESYRVI